MKLFGLRSALYVRRSKEEHQAASIDVQTGEGTSYIAREGGTIAPEHIYVDADHGRAEFKKRPALIAMLNAAERRAFDVVVVRDESRLGGDTNRTSLFMQDLLDAGVRLFYYFTDEEVTIDGAVDKFMINVRNFASELEREKISQRTHEHLLTKARKGLNVGGRVYGYDNVEIKVGEQRLRVEYKINEDQATIVREMFRRYAAGEGLRTIAKDFNMRGVAPPRAGARGTGSWSPAAIWSMLRNERYRGILIWGKQEKAYRKGTKVRIPRPQAEWTTIAAPELRIVDEATWAAAHAQIRPVGEADARRSKGGPRPRHLLSGIARCAECGGPLTVTNGKSSYTPIKVYTCSYRRTRGETVCSNSSRRPVEVVNRLVVDWILEHVLSEQILIDTLVEIRRRLAERSSESSTELPQLEKEASGVRIEINRLVVAITSTDKAPAPLVHALSERQERLDALEARLHAAKAAPAAIELEVRRMEAEAKKRLGDARGAMMRNPEEARRVLQLVLDGPLRVTPIDMPEGRRFQIEGAASFGRFLMTEQDADGRPNSASPAGFEPA